MILEWWDTHEHGDLKSGIWRGRAVDIRGKIVTINLFLGMSDAVLDLIPCLGCMHE